LGWRRETVTTPTNFAIKKFNMKINKKIITISHMLLLLLLCNCLQSSAALFGPAAITGAKSGNIYHAAASYTSNNIIKKKFGKTPAEYVKNIVTQHFYLNKVNPIIFEKNIIENKKLLVDFNNKDNEYDVFISAVKKTLK